MINRVPALSIYQTYNDDAERIWVLSCVKHSTLEESYTWEGAASLMKKHLSCNERDASTVSVNAEDLRFALNRYRGCGYRHNDIDNLSLGECKVCAVWISLYSALASYAVMYNQTV